MATKPKNDFYNKLKNACSFTIDQKTNLLMGLFISSMLLSNLLGAKIMAIELPQILAIILNGIFFPLIFILRELLLFAGGREIPLAFFNVAYVSVGILTVPIMFLVTDIIEEVHGKKVVFEFIKVGVLALIFMIIITSLAVMLPSSERSIDPVAYSSIFNISIRMAFASIIAFVISQLHDMWSFDFLKNKTNGKYLWLRNNVSTIISQLIDSTIFMFIAFYGAFPGWDAIFIISLIIPYWIFKILFALLDTPLAYLGVWWMRKSQ